jgi:hypothetical protein
MGQMPETVDVSWRPFPRGEWHGATRLAACFGQKLFRDLAVHIFLRRKRVVSLMLTLTLLPLTLLHLLVDASLFDSDADIPHVLEHQKSPAASSYPAQCPNVSSLSISSCHSLLLAAHGSNRDYPVRL